LSDLTNQPLERQLADQQLGGLLVLPDLTQGDSSRPVPVRLQYRAKRVRRDAVKPLTDKRVKSYNAADKLCVV